MIAGCSRAPQAYPLAGAPAPARFPAAALAPVHRRIVFQWTYREKIFNAHGEGVARLAPPDSARIDFFLANGASGGYVILIGDSLYLPSPEDAKRYIPPVPLLWASLGRLAVQGRDTVARVDGDTLRADIGQDPVWRVTFGGNTLSKVERIDRQHLQEWIIRSDSAHVTYRHAGAGRTLRLTILRDQQDAAFDQEIWRH